MIPSDVVPKFVGFDRQGSPLLRLVGLYILAHLQVSPEGFFGVCVIMCRRVLASSLKAASARSGAGGSGRTSRSSTGPSRVSGSASESPATSGVMAAGGPGASSPGKNSSMSSTAASSSSRHRPCRNPRSMCHHEGEHGQEESLVVALVPDIQHGFVHLSQMYQHLFATPPKTPCPGIFRWIHGELSRTVRTRPTNMIK